MATIMESGVAPATRGWRLRELWLAQWRATRARATGEWRVRRRWIAWRHERLRRRELQRAAELPDHLRKDIGLYMGLPPGGFTNGGRTFVTDGTPDSTLSGWRW